MGDGGGHEAWGLAQGICVANHARNAGIVASVAGLTDVDRAAALLVSGGHTCVLCRGDETLTSDAHGPAPLVDWLSAGVNLAGFSAADRVVGRAAALLYAAGDVVAVHAVLASEPASVVLAAHGIALSAEQTVPAILNRNRTGSCPMEVAVAGTNDPSLAVPLLRAAIESMRKAR